MSGCLFDISVIRTIIFRRTRTGLIDARDELKASISECMQGNYRPVTATRLWSSDALSIDDLDPDPPAAAESEEEEQGFLERLAEMEEALPKLLTLMNELNEITGEIGSVFQDAQAKVEDMDARGASTSAARLTIAKQMGTQLEQRAARLEKVAEAYERELARADGGMSYMVSAVEQEPDRLQELGELPDAVGVAVAQMREAMAAGDDTANTIASMASIAKPLRQPTRKIATATSPQPRPGSFAELWGPAPLLRRLGTGDELLACLWDSHQG